MPLFGALEAGGTKMVCAIGTETGELLEKTTLPTRTPEETMPALLDFFRGRGLTAVGIGCFGPVELDQRSPRYGTILATPKLPWRNFPIAARFRDALGIPVGFDTDVNAAALGETVWGSARGTGSCVYITVGTGVGLGVVIDGRPHHGMLHPEGGHIFLSRQPDDPLEAGVCPYHANCLEGLASGPALERRWGARAETLTERSAVWSLEANYLAQAICCYIMTLSPEKVILGGGVMKQQTLLPLIRAEVRRQLGGYLAGKGLEHLEDYIVSPRLGDCQGVLGAVKLAMDAWIRESV